MAEELKTFLLGVDDVRSEESVFHVDIHASVVVHCGACVRFVNGVLLFLAGEGAGVETLPQFAVLKMDDITWPAVPAQWHKVFVRMAVKKVKADTGSINDTRWLWLHQMCLYASCRLCRSCSHSAAVRRQWLRIRKWRTAVS